MTILFVSEDPDPTFGSGENIRLCIDATGKLHLVYTENNQLTYATATPGPFTLVMTGTGPLITQKYQYDFHHNVVPGFGWGVMSLFDLAVDSQGTAHICFQGVQSIDHMNLGDVQHAVWNGNQFVSMDILAANAPSVSLNGIAMTIAKNDSVHIAFCDQFGLHYAMRAPQASSFQVLEDVDTTQGSNISTLSIAVGSGGTTGISYIFRQAQAPSSDFQLRFAQRMGSAKWLLDTADPGPLPDTPAIAGLGVFPMPGANSLIIDANGVPHIAYCDAGFRIRHGTWTAAGQGFWAVSPSGNGELVDQAGEASPVKILLDKNNGVHIAYQASPQGAGVAATMTNLRLATRTVSGWATATADPSPISGWAISAAMHPVSGEPHIAHGFGLSLTSTFQLRHTWAVDLLRVPLPKKKRPINIIEQRPT
jgi:hypothetical protein